MPKVINIYYGMLFICKYIWYMYEYVPLYNYAYLCKLTLIKCWYIHFSWKSSPLRPKACNNTYAYKISLQIKLSALKNTNYVHIEKYVYVYIIYKFIYMYLCKHVYPYNFAQRWTMAETITWSLKNHPFHHNFVCVWHF